MTLKFIIIGSILWLSTTDSLFSQSSREDRRGPQGERNHLLEEQIPYKMLSLVTQNPDTMDVYLYLQIRNSQLQFISTEDSAFTATYETTILIRNSANEILQSAIKREKVAASSYANAQSPNSDHIRAFHFPLAPGKYNLFIEIFDLETRQRFTKQEEIVVQDLSKEPLTLSPLLFVKADKKETAPQTLAPLFDPSRLQDDTSLVALLFLVSDGTRQTMHLTQTVMNIKPDTVWHDESSIPIHARIQPVRLHLKQHFPFGKYNLEVIVSDGLSEKKVQETFYVKWGSRPAFMPELDLAIHSLIYVTDESDVKDVLQRSRDEQLKWLEAFWKTRDPDPDTEYNGLEDEYYRRVATTNQRFSTLDESLVGWETDRGRIFIIYGSPSDVERPRMEYGETSRYEVWYYRNLQRRFVFLDRYGMGDYRLLSQE